MVQSSNSRHRSDDKIEATPPQRRRVARLMEDRRATLRVSWVEIAQQAGVSQSKLRDIRHVPDSVFHVWIAEKIETALGWGPGSIINIIGGGKPTILLHATPDTVTDERPTMARDGDIMARWSERLPDEWFWDLVEDIKGMRRNAHAQARRALLDELGIEHDPRDEPESVEQTG